MIILTGHGAFAQEFLKEYEGRVVSVRTTPKKQFIAQVKKATCIIHNAANIECNCLSACVIDNFYLTKYLLDLIHEVNPNVYFIFLSSMSILKSDNAYDNVMKMTPYAYSKYLAETYCRLYPLKKYVCVRFSTLFYKDYKRDGLSKLIYDAVKFKTITLHNNGCAKRDFLPLEIATQYIHKIVNNFSGSNHLMNIVSAKQTSFYEIASYLKRKIPDLSILNKDLPSSPRILSSFSDESIRKLGRIEFSLEKEIDDYIEKINLNKT